MTSAEQDHNDGPAASQALWHLSTTEKKRIATTSGLVLFACALAPYVQPQGASGIQVFLISLCISVAGGLLIVLSVRLFTNRNRKITILLLPALTALACASVVGGTAGYLLTRPSRAPTAPASPATRKPPAIVPESPATSSSSKFSSNRGLTEIADNRNGVPVFGSPDGSTTNAPEIPFATRVKVACYTPNESGMASINDFYLIKSAPWKNAYAPADTFANGDPLGQPGSTNIDPAVPLCHGT
jgi:hypothetical protein